MSLVADASRHFVWGVNDTFLMTWRNVLYYVRNPYWLSFAVVQPIMFTLLFVFVFGGAIETGTEYEDYLLPGIIIQTVIFSSLGSGINIAEDIQKGAMDRFRSLPISRGTVLSARTLSDSVRNVFSALLMAGVGYLVDYRFTGTWVAALYALAIMLAVGYAFSWIAAFIGLMVRTTQTAEMAGFTWSFPLVFASSIFVPVASIKKYGWLQAFARANPITYASDAVRDLSFGRDPGLDAVWALLWCLGIVVVFRTLAVIRFRRLS